MAKRKEVCRVCLRRDTTKYLSLYEKYNECLISEKINSIANLTIKKGDGLPDRICPECLLELESAYRFKQKCEASNIVLLSSNSVDLPSYEEIEIKDEKPSESELPEYDYYDESEIQEEDIKEESTDQPKKSRAVDLKLQCDDCKEFFKSKCKLRVHWKKAHLQSRLICDRCKRQFKSFKAYQVHKKKNLKNCIAAGMVRIEGLGKLRHFFCKECEYKTNRMKDMTTHLVLHSGDRPFTCNICPKGFTQLSSLQTHMETAHHDYILIATCHICGKNIKGRAKLYKHLRQHRAKPVQCEVCNKILKSKQYLQQHMKRHSDVKSYSCEVCAACFYTNSDLANHRRMIHNKVKRFKCDICEYAAYTAETIKKHKAKHSATNIPCLVCGKFSENEQEFLVHQRRHYGKRIQCPHCDSMFYGRKSLSKHIRSKHNCTMLGNRHLVKRMKVKEENSGEQFETLTSLSPDLTE